VLSIGVQRKKKVSEQYWLSPVYESQGNGFYVSKLNNKYYLGYRHKNGKDVSTKISHTTYDVLKKEWK